MKSLEDQITSIKDIFDKIKNAIKAKGVEVSDCDSPEIYADKIGDIELDAGAALNVMAFKSNIGIPEKPVGGTWIWEENKIIYPTGWSNGSGLTGEIYMSQAIFRKDGKILQNWTDPIKITGPAGIPGKDGSKGEKGETGYVQVAERYIFIYKSSINKPNMPTGGSWSLETDEITPPIDWSLSSDLVRPIWMSTGRILRTAPTSPIWSEPIKISGTDGKNGEDGISEEFIYKLTKTSLQVPATPESVNINYYVPDGWTNHPTGIDPENQVEWVSTRQKVNNNWDGFSIPTIWSKWGVNGKDGDGIEYIYYISESGIIPPIDYPEDDYIFQKDGYLPTGWTSAPSGVSSNHPYEFVATRKGSAGNWSIFSNPTLWAKYGDNGENGISILELYAASETAPAVEKTEINPGSVWSIKMPVGTELPIWAITAYINYDGTLATINDGQYGWSDPYIKTGRNGKDGVPTDYVTTVFAESISTPNAPALNVDPKNPGNSTNENGETIVWKVLPDSVSQSWWRCSGRVSGVTELVYEWGTPIKDSGRDGIAKDGKHEEFRYAISVNILISPEINKIEREPAGWITTSDSAYSELINDVKSGKFLFWTKATITPENTLDGEWSEPAPLNGTQGPKGDVGPIGPPGDPGPQGISGIPGTSFEINYTIGSKDNYDNNSWVNSIESIVTTEEKPYIWAKQGKRIYASSEDVGTVTWDAPFKLSGTNGLNGETGKSGQIIYPAGIYDKTKTYKTDNFKAPYVWDTASGKFYVLNDSEWIANQDIPISESSSWVAFDTLDAIYAKIAVVPNALIGSAVYNGDYMFSQQGTGLSDNYADFKITEAKLWENDGDSSHLETFKPNVLINFKTGAAYFGKGAFNFKANGESSFKVNYPDSNQTAIELNSNEGLIQYWPNGQVQKKDVWELKDGKAISVVTYYYDQDGKIIAMTDSTGEWTKVSNGAWGNNRFLLPNKSNNVITNLSNLNILDLINKSTDKGFIDSSKLYSKELYYYYSDTETGDYYKLLVENYRKLLDPAPNERPNDLWNGIYYNSYNVSNYKYICESKNISVNLGWKANYNETFKNNSSSDITSLSYNLFPFDQQNWARTIPVIQTFKIKFNFRNVVNGGPILFLLGKPLNGNIESKDYYIMKVYTGLINPNKNNLDEIEKNSKYFISETDFNISGLMSGSSSWFRTIYDV